jgi:hypothetical protein
MSRALVLLIAVLAFLAAGCWPGCHDPNSAPQPHP